MTNSSQHENMSPDTLISRLLKTEHDALVHWLHDDLGQNLIAIKSFSAAILEQSRENDDDTPELAAFINDAADSSFRATYNLMQELRAEQMANQSIDIALAQCIQESGLKEKGISHQLDVELNIDGLDVTTKSIILRSVRTYINCCKASESVSEIKVCLKASTGEATKTLVLKLEHIGSYAFSESDFPELQRLRDRIEAIDGEFTLLQNSDEACTLMLKFDPVSNNRESN